MSAKQTTTLLDVMKQFKDEMQTLVKKTQSEVKGLIMRTTNDITKLAANNPKIKNIIKHIEDEQKRYEKIFADLQNKALNLYKEKAESTISDIKNKIENYKKQAEKLYKETITREQAATKKKTLKKVTTKSTSKSKKNNKEQQTESAN